MARKTKWPETPEVLVAEKNRKLGMSIGLMTVQDKEAKETTRIPTDSSSIYEPIGIMLGIHPVYSRQMEGKKQTK